MRLVMTREHHHLKEISTTRYGFNVYSIMIQVRAPNAWTRLNTGDARNKD